MHIYLGVHVFFFLGWWGVTGNGCLCECGLFYFFIFSRLFFFIHLFIFARYWIRVAKLQNSVFLTCRHYLALCAGSRQEGVGCGESSYLSLTKGSKKGLCVFARHQRYHVWFVICFPPCVCSFVWSFLVVILHANKVIHLATSTLVGFVRSFQHSFTHSFISLTELVIHLTI